MKNNNQHQEGLEKFRSLAEEVRICMFTTINSKGELSSRPMATVSIDEDGNVWFFTNEYSEKVQEVSHDNSVHLIYSHPGKNIYLNVRGHCQIIEDKNKMKEYWSPLYEAWFPKGLEDPALCLAKVRTDEAYYWNADTTKMGVIFNIIKSVVTGEKFKEGESGKIDL